MNIDRICLVEFHRPDVKFATLAELIAALTSTLNQQGIQALYRQNDIDPDALNIVFGSHRLFQAYENLPPFPGNCVFFNLERLYENSKDGWHRRYLELLKKSSVIDYAPKNCDLLKRIGGHKPFQFRFGYIPLSSFSFPPRGQQLLFYGNPMDRRKAIMEKLIQAGTPLRAVVNYWGYERDYEVSTCRAVVNISKYEHSILEVYRLWHSLCLGTPVISERGVDQKLADEWRDYVLFVDSLGKVGDEELRMIPDAGVYSSRTSFHDEVTRLKEWLQSVR